MSNRSTVHDTFVIDRTFAFKREFVYAAWTSAEAKSKWFVGPSGWELQLRGTTFFDARYHEIVPNERIVYVYDMHTNDARGSISLATIEFKERKEGTGLIITEQGVFLDGHYDVRDRERGTQGLIDQLEQALQRQAATATGRT